MACSACRQGSSSGLCGTSNTHLRNYRKQATTLYNTTKDLNKKAEYKLLITDIDSLLFSINEICPPQEALTIIKTFLDSEYSQHIR